MRRPRLAVLRWSLARFSWGLLALTLTVTSAITATAITIRLW